MTQNSIRETLERTAKVVRRIIGAPDYETYVAHIRECHAGTTPMTREEFERSRMDDKYSRPGQRCC